MMNRLMACFLMCLPISVLGQSEEDRTRATGLPELPRITSTAIPGAPILGQPALINGSEQDIRTEKHGLAYPALYDWNGDGKTDLLLGEFETGDTGSDVKVYLNEGTNQKPRYSGRYSYAEDTAGNRITTHEWCCIGTHPRFVDIDNDGDLDMLSGQYNPGLINWWPGEGKGFGPRRFVEQEGYVEGARLDSSGYYSQLDPRSNDYWNYTSAAFADFNGDGLQDLFVGGFGEFRVALNVGKPGAPKFGLRQYLLGVDGYPLSVVKPTPKEMKAAAAANRFPHFAGVIKSFVTPYDWDGDGVLDLLVTHVYADKDTKDPVVFFRGVQTDKGLRFQDAVSLFTAADAQKTFPGCQPNIAIADYNADGVMDLVIGVSLPTVNGFEVDPKLTWSYLHELKVETPGKDIGRIVKQEGSVEAIKKKIEADPQMKTYYIGELDDYKYLTVRHRGYVYVMLGRANPVKATPLRNIKAQAAVAPPVNQTAQSSQDGGPVSYEVRATAVIGDSGMGLVEVNFSYAPGWYGYADTPANIAAGWIPTTVEFELPAGLAAMGKVIQPRAHAKGGADVYDGRNVNFAQRFYLSGVGESAPAHSFAIKARIQYQTCNQDMCLPPVREEVVMKVRSKALSVAGISDTPEGQRPIEAAPGKETGSTGTSPEARAVLEQAEAALKNIRVVEAQLRSYQDSDMYGHEETYSGTVRFRFNGQAGGWGPIWYETRQSVKGQQKHFRGVQTEAGLKELDLTNEKVMTGGPEAESTTMIVGVLWEPYGRADFLTGMADIEAQQGFGADTVRLRGVESVNGRPCHVIESFSSQDPPGFSYAQRYYFDTTDHLLRRKETDISNEDGRKLSVSEVTSLRINPPLSADAFEIKVPEHFTVERYTASRDKQPLQVNVPAPDWTLPDAQGVQRSLGDYRDQLVLLDFWATWCGPCKGKMPYVQELHEEFAGKGLKIISVLSSDAGHEKEAEQYLQRHGYTFDLVFGNEAVSSAYRIRYLPTVVLVDRNGRVVHHRDTPGMNDGVDEKVELREAILKHL